LVGRCLLVLDKVDPLHRRKLMSQNSVEVSVRSKYALCGLLLVFLLPTKASDDGESTSKAQCLKCHGPNGEGNGHAQMKLKPADLQSDAVQQLSVFKTIAYGVGHKEYAHAFAERLSSKQIADLVTYIRRFAKTTKKQNKPAAQNPGAPEAAGRISGAVTPKRKWAKYVCPRDMKPV
jgi:cytochrome c553